jgi:hypothetical protein
MAPRDIPLEAPTGDRRYFYNPFGPFAAPSNPNAPPVMPLPPGTPNPTLPVITPTPTTPTTPANVTARNNALALARLGISQELQRRGMAPDAYQAEFDSYLNNILGAIPQDATDFSQYFTPNLASDVLSGIQARERNQYRGQVNQGFGANFAQQYLPDTLLDDTINETLNSQYGSVFDTLQRGLARGQYNQRGYDAGLNNLDISRQAALAKLNGIEGGILSNYRTRLGDVRNNAFNAATGYQLGDSFNIDDYFSQANNIADTARQNASGEFFSALGSTPLFDLGNIGNAAGQAQGAVNLNNLDVREGQERRRLAAARGRGLGSQGAF